MLHAATKKWPYDSDVHGDAKRKHSDSCSTLQDPATHINTLQHNAIYCNTLFVTSICENVFLNVHKSHRVFYASYVEKDIYSSGKSLIFKQKATYILAESDQYSSRKSPHKAVLGMWVSVAERSSLDFNGERF